jgi:ribosome biogenesis GTPase
MDFDLVRIRLGWGPERQAQLESLGDTALFAARVGVAHRGAYGLLGCPVETARVAGRFRADNEDAASQPVVGDWVAVRSPTGSDAAFGIIEAILPRTGLLERSRPGVPVAQPIAANVDVAFVVAAAERSPNLRRIERTMALAAAGGARPVVVLNKMDLAATADEDLGMLRALGGGTTCLATSTTTGAGIDELRAEVPPGTTGVLLGPSGAGKSSLMNSLLGEQRLATGAVRQTDAKGRHTTTRRELIELPGAGCLIDTPGVRELGLWQAGEGIETAFDDVTALAAACRFRDCTHGGEPGCAVGTALANGALDAARFANFEKLRREGAFLDRQTDPRNAAAGKGRSRTIHKQQRARRTVDPKLRDD